MEKKPKKLEKKKRDAKTLSKTARDRHIEYTGKDCIQLPSDKYC